MGVGARGPRGRWTMLFKHGSQGLYVRAIQLALNAWSGDTQTPLAPDGKFGPLTQGRVKAFQRAMKIGVDGIVGPITLSHLFTGVQLQAAIRVKNRPKAAATTPQTSPPSPVQPTSAGSGGGGGGGGGGGNGANGQGSTGGIAMPAVGPELPDPIFANWKTQWQRPSISLLSPQQRQEFEDTLERIRLSTSHILVPGLTPPLPPIGILPPVSLLPRLGPFGPAPPPPPLGPVPPPNLTPAKRKKDVSHLGARVDITFDPNAETHDVVMGTVLMFGVLGPPEKSPLTLEVLTKPFTYTGTGPAPRLWDFEASAVLKPFKFKPLPWFQIAPIMLSTLDVESWQLFAGVKPLIDIRLHDHVSILIGGKLGAKYKYKFDPKEGKSHHKVEPFRATGTLTIQGHF